TTPPVTATISGAPVGATIRYSLDGSAYTTYTGPFPVSGEGIHFILATDDQNDMGATVVPIDTTAPTVSASLQPDPDPTSGWNSGTTTVTLKAVDGGGSGVTQTIWTATGAQPGNATVNGDTAQIVISNDGQTTITFHAVDSVGHIGPTNQITVKVDTEAPTITINAPTATSYYSGATVNASFTCTDGDSGVASCVGTVPNGSPISTTPGAHTFTVNATDNVGNTATKSVTYTVPTVVAVTAGGNHTCALLSDTTARCWGSNSNGQLGDGTTTQRLLPVMVKNANGTGPL